MPSSHRYQLVGAFAVLYLVWGSTYLCVAIALRAFPPFMLMSIRCILGGFLLSAYAAWCKGQRISRADVPEVVVCGLLFFVGCHGILANVQQRVDSGLASILLATIPLWLTMFKLTGHGAGTSMGRSLLLLPAMVGLYLVARSEASASGHDSAWHDWALLLGAAFSWAVGTALSERPARHAAPHARAGAELLSGGLVLAALSACSDEFARFEWSSLQLLPVAALAFLALAGTGAAFACYLWLLQRVPSPVVATYTFVNPVVAVALGWAFLGERVSTSMLLGAALVVATIAASLAIEAQVFRTRGSGARS